MKILPPCKKDGVDCDRRHVGCRAECKEWNKWQEIHEAECAEVFRQKQTRNDADAFLAAQGERNRLGNARIRAKERREGKR